MATILLSFLQVLAEHLRQKCLEEHVDKNVQPVKGYSVLNQAPKEWEIDQNQPCGSERQGTNIALLCVLCSLCQAQALACVAMQYKKYWITCFNTSVKHI